MTKLLLIDSRILDISEVTSHVMPDVDTVIFQYFGDTFESLKEKITSQYESVCIVQHNYKFSDFKLINSMEPCEIDSIISSDPELNSWSPIIEFFSWLKSERSVRIIDLLYCNIWSDSNWVYAIEQLEHKTGIDIRASVNLTGAGGDFIMESDNVDLIGVYFTPEINTYKHSFVYQPNGSGSPAFSWQGLVDIPLDGGILNTNKFISLIGDMSNCGDSGTYGTYIRPPAQITGVATVTYTSAYQVPVSYAVLKKDGTVVTFGHAKYGGDSSTVASQLVGITKIVAGQQAFAALRSDGTVVCWGCVDDINVNTATSNNVSIGQVNLTNCSDIVANQYGFVALKKDGTAARWGAIAQWPSPASELTNLVKIYAAYGFAGYAFAGLRNNGHVVMWGRTSVGVTTSLTSTSPVIKVYPIEYGFIMIRANGDVHNGLTNSILYTLPAGAYVTNVVPTPAAYNPYHFAILFSDRQMYLSVTNQMYQNVSEFKVNETAYAYIQNGAVTCSGDIRFGGSLTGANGIYAGDVNSNVMQIASSPLSFAALKTDGSVVVWGANKGGRTDVAPVYSYLTSGVEYIQDLYSGYMALKSDGTIVSWGQDKNRWSGTNTDSNSLSSTYTLPEGRTATFYNVNTSAIILDMSAVNQITLDIYSTPPKLTYITNVQARMALLGHTYGLYVGSTELATYTPLENTYTYIFNSQSLLSCSTASLVIKDITLSSNIFTLKSGLTIPADNFVVPTPNPPTITGVTFGQSQAVIAFTPGASNGPAITGYKYSTDGTNYTLASETSSPITVTGLTNGETYSFYLKAVSSGGDSIASNQSSSGSPSAPVSDLSAPVITGVTTERDTATVSFTHTDFASTFVYKYSINNGAYRFCDVDNSTKTFIVNKLTYGSTYNVKMVGLNSALSSSPESNTYSPFVPYTVPSTPVIDQVHPGNGSATIYFTIPSTNGRPITKIRYSTGGAYMDASGTSSPIIITGLTNKVTYNFTILASNVAGESSASLGKSVTVGAPLPPIITSVAFGNKFVNISFTNSNTSPITGIYGKIDGTPDASFVKLSGITSPVKMPNLTNGSSYKFILKFVNSNGSSPNSNLSSSIIPAAVPVAPTITNAALTDIGKVTVNFIAGANGGSAITGYKYQINKLALRDASGLSSPLILDISNNVPSSIKIYAVNAAGVSIGSRGTATFNSKYLVPPAPTGIKLTASYNILSVNFAAPVTDSRTPILTYKYVLNPVVGGTDVWVDASTTTAPILIPVSNNVLNTVKIAAVNMVGQGASTAVPAPVKYIYLAPGVPGFNLSVTGSAGSKTLTVTCSVPPANGSPITGYSYSISKNGSVVRTGTSSTNSFTLTGFTTGVHSISMASVNNAGTSAYSTAKNFTI